MPTSHPKPPPHRRPFLLGDTRLQAVLVGGALAALCHAMATRGDIGVMRSGLGAYTAAVMVLAGGAAFLLFALHRHGGGRTLPGARVRALLASWVPTMGAAFVAVAHWLA